MDIKIIENFIDKEDADKIINYIESNKHNPKKFAYGEYLKTKESQYAQAQIPEMFSLEDHNEIKDIYIKYINKFKEECLKFFKNADGMGIFAAWMTMYGMGNELPIHRDNHENAEDIDFSCVIYLNDNFEGGELFLKDFNYIYKPKALSIIIFHPEYWHEVKTMKSGFRYAIPIWGTLNKEKMISLI